MPQAGLLELVAHGIQDIYLIGNPQITFFKTVYKRHTNFSMEAFQLSYDALPQFGAKTTFNITRYGDLIHTMLLEVDLPAIGSNYTYDAAVGVPGDYAKGEGSISWVNNTGHALINYLDLKIGDQLIDRQYGEWMEIWTQLSQSEAKKRGLDLMLNRNDTLIVNPGPLTLYIPTQFWFCRNIGLALPLIALQYHNVTLEVNFRPLSQLYTFGANTYYNVTSNGTAYLQVYKPYTATPNLDNGSQAYKMVFPDGSEYFIHPTATIGGAGQTGTPGQPYIIQLTQPVVGTTWSNASAYIKPNGVLDITTSGTPTISDLRLYVDYIYLDFEERYKFGKETQLYLIEQLQYNNGSSFSQHVTNPSVDLNFNHPVKELIWTIQRNDINECSLDNDSNFSYGNDWFNYSLSKSRLINNINDTFKIFKLQLNGNDRMKEFPATYFRLVQPYLYHTRIPTNYIYVYSFGLKPEEAQPTGTCNFSLIDNIRLYFEMNKFRKSDYTIKIWAINYNVLLFCSGLAGIAFS